MQNASRQVIFFPEPPPSGGSRFPEKKKHERINTRQVEVALSGVENGKIEAARSMGSGTMGIIFRIYLHEAVPALIRVTTVTAISLIGLTTMAGAVGAGGIGSFAINYGQNQNYPDIVNVCVIVLLIVTIVLQSLGNGLSRLTVNRGLILRRHRRETKTA